MSLLSIYLILTLITYFVLSTDNDLQVSILKSYVVGDYFTEQNTKALLIVASLLSPVTFFEIIYIKIKLKQKFNINLKKNMKQLITILVLILLGYGIVQGTKQGVAYYNQSVGYELELKQTLNQRLTIIDRITKIVHQKLEIAKLNDSSYYKNLSIIATSRVDKQGLFMKWVTENNPNANYNEVSALYKDVSASIENERNQLQAIEDKAQTIVYGYDKLQNQLPSSLYLLYRPKTLKYEPISTELNKLINQSGVDNQVNL